MLDTPRTWRYQSAVLLGPCPNLPDQPNRGPEEGWGAPIERPSARSVLHGAPAAENLDLFLSSNEPRKSQARSSSSQLLMQASQQVSLLTPRATAGFIPGAAGGVRAFAGVAQLVEHLFCKQVVSGSIPLASSSEGPASFSSLASSILRSENSEGCPSGQREQAVNLPAHAYVGSNPTPSTNVDTARTARGPLLRPQALLGAAAGMGSPRRGLRPSRSSAGVTQLVESQFSKLKVDGSSPFSRSNFLFLSVSRLLQVSQGQKQTRPASLLAGEALARTGAERTSVREHRTAAEAQPPAKIAGRRYSRSNVTHTNIAHLAQLVEHVLGKDEVISSNLMVGSTEVQPKSHPCN